MPVHNIFPRVVIDKLDHVVVHWSLFSDYIDVDASQKQVLDIMTATAGYPVQPLPQSTTTTTFPTVAAAAAAGLYDPTAR